MKPSPSRPGASVVIPSAEYEDLVRQESAARGLDVSLTIADGPGLVGAIRQCDGDATTGAVGLIVQAIPDGAAFMAAIAGAGKPVVVLGVGRGERGRRALGVGQARQPEQEQLYQAAIGQAGGLAARDSEELFDAVLALACSAETAWPSGAGGAILSLSPGLGALAADACEDAHLDLPALAPETQAQLAELAPGLLAADNPVLLDSQTSGEQLAKALALLSADSGVGGIILILAALNAEQCEAALEVWPETPWRPQEPPVNREIESDSGASTPPRAASASFSAKLLAGANRRKALVLCSGPAAGFVATERRQVPCFPTPERAARACRALMTYAERQSTKAQHSALSTQHSPEPMNIEGEGVMDEHETKRLLDRWGVAVVPGTLVTGPGRNDFTPVRKLAIHFGFPVVLKAIRRDIVDKAGMGAVASGLATVDQLQQAWGRMHERFPDAAWLVHPMLPGDVELVVGARRDPVFGPYVFFGGGGIMTELYGDVSMRIAPFSTREAVEMIEETKAAQLLRGFHGLPVHDLAEIGDVLVRVGQLMLGQPTVQQLEINPLLVTEKGPIVTEAIAVIGA
ncbi:MAG: acetate--CoA ligase family protein [Chloroflexota bacterium]|nr:acetate--CoA ligase family protein [Chloroflexota bacterium]